MALRASICAGVSLCASMRILREDPAAGAELRMYLYALRSAGAEAMIDNNTLLEEKLVNTFRGTTVTEFTVTVTGKNIERHSDLIECGITWTESSGTLTQEMVTARTGMVGDGAPFLCWGEEDDANMKKSTFNFRPDKFAKIPDNDDEWKDYIVSSNFGVEKSKIVIVKIRHAGISFSRDFFESDVFWWENEGEQINRVHQSDVLLLSGEEVQMKKATFEYDVTDAATTMPTTDGGWEALIANMEGATDVPFMRIIQYGLNQQKTKFRCGVIWVGNHGRRSRRSAFQSRSGNPSMMLDDAMRKTTFTFRPERFATIPNTDDQWKDYIVSSYYGIEKSSVVIGRIRPTGIDFDRQVFQFDVFWCDKTCEQPKQTKPPVQIDSDDDPSWNDQEVQVTQVHFAVSDAVKTMPTTDEEWEELIKKTKSVTHVKIVNIMQQGLNRWKTTFGVDVFWV